jgi:hypothetical protein
MNDSRAPGATYLTLLRSPSRTYEHVGTLCSIHLRRFAASVACMAVMLAAVLNLLLLAGCGDRAVPPPVGASAPASRVNADSEWFTDRAKESGLDFVHSNGMSGAFYLAEILAPGVAFVGYVTPVHGDRGRGHGVEKEWD